jgi:disulfide bond formation protein DsbB
MEILPILFIAVIAAGVMAWLHIVFAKPTIGSPAIAALLSAVFAGYTAVQIGTEGAAMFYVNHTGNLTCVQVWWDLVMCVLVALFLIAPRARAVGMNMVPWAMFVALTASIGLLAMAARLFWLEIASDRPF